MKGYYTATKYDISNGEVLSVVICVEPGDRIAASSFASKSENMGSVNGIRLTYLLGTQIVSSLSAGEVYSSYTFNRSNVGNGAVDYTSLINTDGAYITPTNFGEAYGIMLHKMQMAYPDAQIFAMPLLPTFSPLRTPPAS